MPQYASTPERERILHRYPDYSVEILEAPGHFRVTLDDAIIAESDRALEVHESFHEVVIYFPLDAVRPGVLEETEHQTYCPFKGDASYYAVRTGETRVENAAWSYRTPMGEVAELAGHLAFYPERLQIVRGD
jgi:uncharacterized protein (DUF427 family)